jgi:hypothetical protein
MDTRTRLIIPTLVAATVAAAVTVASAAPATTPGPSGCLTPRLVGKTEQAALRTARAAGCVVYLAGARLKQATVQTIAGQTPAPGTRSVAVTLTLNPLCFGLALSGPPHDEGMRRGPTELITGLYLVGGPALPYSSPHCRRPSGETERPAPGTIDVRDPTGTLVASRTTKRGRLETFRLRPGRYRVSGGPSTSGSGSAQQRLARSVTIRAGYTTRRYVIEPVP